MSQVYSYPEKSEKKKLKRSEEELAERQAIHEVIQRLQFSSQAGAGTTRD